MISFVLGMLLFPEAQAKAQEEIDSAIGSNRLPTFEDRVNLPYTERLVAEVFRWQPVSPLGKNLHWRLKPDIFNTIYVAFPHVCDQEDEYRGYRISKGSIM